MGKVGDRLRRADLRSYPFGWRIAVAILGILSVLAVARIVRRLTRSNLIGTLAGLFLAIDGLAIVMSRTALLDNSLMFFVVLAFGALLLDRDRTRPASRRSGDNIRHGSRPLVAAVANRRRCMPGPRVRREVEQPVLHRRFRTTHSALGCR